MGKGSSPVASLSALFGPLPAFNSVTQARWVEGDWSASPAGPTSSFSFVPPEAGPPSPTEGRWERPRPQGVLPCFTSYLANFWDKDLASGHPPASAGTHAADGRASVVGMDPGRNDDLYKCGPLAHSG